MPILTCKCEVVWLKLFPVEDGAVADTAPRDAAGSLVAEDELVMDQQQHHSRPQSDQVHLQQQEKSKPSLKLEAA